MGVLFSTHPIILIKIKERVLVSRTMQVAQDMTPFKVAIQFQQRSAEIHALQIQAYNVAEQRLKEHVKNNKTGKRPAVVLDLDETVLNNLPVVAYGYENKIDFTNWGEEWEEWVDAACADAIPGAKDFLQVAHDQDVKIFYVSNREVHNKKPTIKNLEKLELPQVSEDTVLLHGEIGTKEDRRSKIRKEYEIVLLVGNSLYDLSSDFIQETVDEQHPIVKEQAEEFGNRFILLPNSSYGDYWVDANLEPWK